MKRIPAIDGFRAIAILMVIAFHYINNQLVGTTTGIGRVLYQLTGFGWVGVDLFFVLSGFLIGSILLINRTSPKLFKTFYIRRLLRIVPNYYFLLVIFLLVKSLSYFKDDYFLTGNDVIPTWSYFAMLHNLFMADMANLGNSAMSVTWSIGIEEQFYLLFPVVIIFVKERWLPWFLIAMILLAIVCRSFFNHWIPAYVLLPCRMDALCFGILIAWLRKNYALPEWVKRNQQRILLVMGIVALACAVLFYLYRDLGVIRNSLFALLFACLIVLALGKPNSYLNKILSNSTLGWIGKISYSLYLFHYLILGLCKHIAGRFFSLESSMVGISVSIFALLFSVLFSWWVYQYLEAPAVAVGKKYKYS